MYISLSQKLTVGFPLSFIECQLRPSKSGLSLDQYLMFLDRGGKGVPNFRLFGADVINEGLLVKLFFAIAYFFFLFVFSFLSLLFFLFFFSVLSLFLFSYFLCFFILNKRDNHNLKKDKEDQI